MRTVWRSSSATPCSLSAARTPFSASAPAARASDAVGPERGDVDVDACAVGRRGDRGRAGDRQGAQDVQRPVRFRALAPAQREHPHSQRRGQCDPNAQHAQSSHCGSPSLGSPPSVGLPPPDQRRARCLGSARRARRGGESTGAPSRREPPIALPDQRRRLTERWRALRVARVATEAPEHRIPPTIAVTSLETPIANVEHVETVLSELRARMTRSEAPSRLPCLRRRHFGDQCMPAPDEASSLLGQGDALAAATASAQVLAELLKRRAEACR